MKKIYIYGAGGFSCEVLWLIKRINKVEPVWEIKGFIDDNEEIKGTIHHGYPVLGGSEYLKSIDEAWVLCAIGSARVKKRAIAQLAEMNNVKFATVIDPSVIMSDSVQIGEGSIICAGTILTVNITVGKHVIINLDCTVGHDGVIEDYATVYPSVNISGNVVVGEAAELGTGTQIIQGKSVGENSMIGAGAVIINDIPRKCTAVGSPAKPIKYFE